MQDFRWNDPEVETTDDELFGSRPMVHQLEVWLSHVYDADTSDVSWPEYGPNLRNRMGNTEAEIHGVEKV